MSKLDDAADRLDRTGKRLTKALTVPIILIFVGLLIMPIGLILWLIAVLIFIGSLSEKKK